MRGCEFGRHARDSDEAPPLRTVHTRIWRVCSCLALIASAVAEGRRVHIKDPPAGARGYLGGLACGNLVGG